MTDDEDTAREAPAARAPQPPTASPATAAAGDVPRANGTSANGTSANGTSTPAPLTALTTELFGPALESLPLGAALVWLGPRGQRRILAANPSLAEMLGVPVEDLPGRDFAEFDQPEPTPPQPGPSECLGGELPALRALVHGERSACVRRKRYRRTDGRSVWAELRATVLDIPAPSADGDDSGVVTLATFADVTARQQVEHYRALVTATKVAVTNIVTQVLAGAPEEEIYHAVVDRVAHLFDAESVTLQLIDSVTGPDRVVAGVGPAHEMVLSGHGELPPDLARKLVEVGVHILTEPLLDWARPLVGPVITARFGQARGDGGLLAAGRPPGAEPFTEAEGELLLAMGQQVALAVEIGRARADQERLTVLEDRERIARDLNDTVIQDLIAIGIQLDAGLIRESDPTRRRRDTTLIEQLEEAVRRLRGSVFDLRGVPAGPSLGDAVHGIASDAAHALGHFPTVTVTGRLDAVPEPLSHAVLDVLRESLSNVARHAHATTTSVLLVIDGEQVRLDVDDDGRGLPDDLAPGEGLTNIRDRAAAFGGDAVIAARAGGGTRLTWSCPLPRG